MSYLLDALNKSRGDHTQKVNTPQPVMYQQAAFQADDGINVYKWISIILALILTLIIGIVLGNKYILLNVEPTNQQPTLAYQPSSQVQQQPKPVVVTKEDATSTTAVKTAPKPTQAQNIVKQQPKEQVPVEQEQIVIGAKPTANKKQNEVKDTGLVEISDDLLKKFNDAIKKSENVDIDETFSTQQETETATQEYFSKVPRITELNRQQQSQIPTLTYQTHLYSSDKLERRVKLNGKTLQVGQWINDNIQIKDIQQFFVILQMDQLRFSLPALTDWHSIN
jgi:general secretion pathway protein B